MIYRYNTLQRNNITNSEVLRKLQAYTALHKKNKPHNCNPAIGIDTIVLDLRINSLQAMSLLKELEQKGAIKIDSKEIEPKKLKNNHLGYVTLL